MKKPKPEVPSFNSVAHLLTPGEKTLMEELRSPETPIGEYYLGTKLLVQLARERAEHKERERTNPPKREGGAWRARPMIDDKVEVVFNKGTARQCWDLCDVVRVDSTGFVVRKRGEHALEYPVLWSQPNDWRWPVSLHDGEKVVSVNELLKERDDLKAQLQRLGEPGYVDNLVRNLKEIGRLAEGFGEDPGDMWAGDRVVERVRAMAVAYVELKRKLGKAEEFIERNDLTATPPASPTAAFYDGALAFLVKVEQLNVIPTSYHAMKLAREVVVQLAERDSPANKESIWRLEVTGDAEKDRAYFVEWLRRNEHTGPHCSPPWSRNGSAMLAYMFEQRLDLKYEGNDLKNVIDSNDFLRKAREASTKWYEQFPGWNFGCPHTWHVKHDNRTAACALKPGHKGQHMDAFGTCAPPTQMPPESGER